MKAKAKGDALGVEQLQDQLGREIRRLHTDWEEKKAAVHGETTPFEAEIEQLEKEPSKKRTKKP